MSASLPTPESQNANLPDTSSSSSSPLTSATKESAVFPDAESYDDQVELKDFIKSDNEGHLPVEEDIMQLARLGEIGAIQKLFDSGKYNALYRDEQNITPLHWAAINNRYELCMFLLDSGADVNAKGGDSVATPAMWAVQRCHYYVVDLLILRGADPLLTDAQGYNMLHLATMDGNAFLLVLLLLQDIPVDVPDSHGHTGLMWAAYKGYPVLVDIFLRWGADVNATDEAGLSPLHWALVRGSTPCIHKILEYGADRFAKTSEGKTPETVAQEMKTTGPWRQALNECGYNASGDVIQLPLGLAKMLRTRYYVSKYFFLWPFAMVFGAVWILSNFSIFISVPLALLFTFGMQFLAQWVGNRSIPEFRVLQRTPFLAGVFAASLFWVGVRWFSVILPGTFADAPLFNIIFLILYALTTYFYFLAMMEDPGFVPKLPGREQQRGVITDLLIARQFDENNFCVNCMIRKPLRSKHCRRCKRCVSKHDHHCPWIDNCVGTNNLRHFILYIFTLEVGIAFYIQLVVKYLDVLPPPPSSDCNIVSQSVCSILNRDPFTIVLTLWTALQLVWVSMLCVVQLVQIARNQTTYENIRGHPSTGYHDPSSQSTIAQPGDISGQTSTAHSGRHHHGGWFSQCKKVLGLDTFMATAQDGLGDRRMPRSRNPFSRGIVTNCRDFWLDPAPYFGIRQPGSSMLDGEVVNYNEMYEVPQSLRARSGMVYSSVATHDVEAMA